MGFVPPSAYDRAITVFSPDGRIFQVEYAFEPVRKGTTAIGIGSKDAVVLAVEEKPFSSLQDTNVAQKLFQVDAHVGAAVAGLMGDARILIDQARVFSQSNRLTYDEPIDIEILSKRVGDVTQLYTQHAGVRPFGASIIFAGVDRTGSRVFLTEPSGAYWGFKAVSIGAGAETVKSLLEKHYREDITVDNAILMSLYCLSKVIEAGLNHEKIKVALVPADLQKFKILTREEIDGYLKKLPDFKNKVEGQ